MSIVEKSRKICSLILAFAMIFSMADFSMFARAAEVSEPISVTSADALETALKNGSDLIKVENDFLLDRTFYITEDTTIYSDIPVTLTRSADFGGDIFVVGESEDGSICEDALTFNFGNPDCGSESMLTVDGNSENMTTAVSGTVLFVCGSAQVNLYGVTITNCAKVENERVLNEKYNLPYTGRIGGAAAILASGTMNVYGGVFSNNTVNDETSSEEDGMISTQGGAIYSFGALNIYGAIFENNHAARAGALYNYGETHIYNADFIENSASYRGGAVYMPNTTNCKLFLGEETDLIESSVLFDSNTSENRGGAIFAQGTLDVNNSHFVNNSSTSDHGGAIFASEKLDGIDKTLSVENSVFESNSAYYNGGAIYLTNAEAYLSNTDFTENKSLATANANGSRYGGGAIYSTGSSSELHGVSFAENNSDYNGGAMALYSSSSAIFNNVTADSNTAATHGGALYVNNSEIELTGTTFNNNTGTTNGGAVYSGNSTVTISDVDFTNNSTNGNGGALYSTGSTVVADVAEFTNNAAGSYGGGISMHRVTDTQVQSDVKLNKITASGNSSSKSGGFLYNNHSLLSIYNSSINTSSSAKGGAISVNGDAESNIYASSFTGNTCAIDGTNGYGGVLYVDTNNKTTLVHSCTFDGNTSNYFGGVVYIGQTGSSLNMYNTIAKNNSAPKGAVVYATKTGTVVTINGMTVSGNTVTDGGPVVWGNTKYCTLNINKNNFTDLDHTGALDDAYWNNAIANEIAVYNLDFDVPGYKDWGEEGGDDEEEDSVIVVGITSAEQLKKALDLGYTNFRIDADFQIDRTLYITQNTHIFANGNRTLTRSANFAGDMFVVGETSSGSILEDTVVLTIGKEEATASNTLTIDGNSENMSVDVSGTVVFVCGVAQADLYSDVTIKNCKKVANERTLLEKYNLSYTGRIGGAAVILAAGSMNIYGTVFENNVTNDETSAEEDGMISSQGGAVYSFGALNIYDAKFLNNYAAKGAALYNYRETHIYNGEFKENHASDRGGAVYMANSVKCKLVLGEDLDGKASKVVFDGNTTPGRGAAVYVQGVFKANNTEFKNNIADGAGGAIASFGNEGITDEKTLTVTNSVFDKNESSGGGAVALYSLTSAQFDNVTFTSNKSSTTGGAVVANSSTNAKMYNCTFTSNEATTNGGGFMASTATAYFKNAKFISNKVGTNGGALYSTGSTVEIDVAEFTNNSASGNGGAISMHRVTDTQVQSNLILNKITATGNTATKLGGFLYNNHSILKMYNSTIKDSHSDSHGGAICLQGVAETNIYATAFINNSCGSAGSSINGGAMYVYTTDTTTLTHGCTFDGNSSPNFGGAIYVSNGCGLTMYNSTAKNNNAVKGGFMYETTTGTQVIVNGMTVSGNTASGGGPIIWGNTTNAKLSLNKTNFVDLDHSGTLDSTYWESAIANKLTVTEITDEIPRYQDYGNELYDEYTDVTDVKSAAELEAAINNGVKNIRVVESFEIDRTFYITNETVIFSTASKTLKRAPNFAGDIFVVGEDADGNGAIALGRKAHLTLGNQYSESTDLLIIDGNSQNMTVDVVGSVLFLAESGQIDLYKNVSINNNRKVGNDRILNEKYLVGSNAYRAGGAAIIVSDGTVNVYGAKFKNNICKPENNDPNVSDTELDSSLGGAVYNKGTFNIYDGVFEGNEAARGGFIYNNRALKVVSGQFIGNHATTNGGAIYLASSQFSQLFAGNSENAVIGDSLLFKDNSSASNGGAVYCASMAVAIMYGNITFDGNKTDSNGGAIATYGTITADNITLKNNYAYGMGGAMYIANSNEDTETRIVTVKNSVFDNNTASRGGAFSVYASNDELSEGGIANVENCTFTKNKAVNTKDTPVTSNVFGGAVYITRNGSITVTDSAFEENEALFEGGAFYCAGESTTDISNTTFTKNKTTDETDSRGGAISVHSATVNVAGTNFTQNSSVTNGGAFYVSYTTAAAVNSQVSIENSNFTLNNAGANGGALYTTKHKVETDEDEIVTVRNTTFDQNNADGNGGAAYITSAADAYMKDVIFTNNTAYSETENTYGGAICLASSAEVEIDGAEFTGNSTSYSAGAISLNTAARATLNNIKASGNSAPVSAGCIYVNNARLDMYNSEIANNTAGANGGGMALYNAAITNVNNTLFEGNTAEGNGGAIYDYTVETEGILHTCTFNNNKSANFGGAIYASNSAVLDMYNIVARNNEAKQGGVMYETTTDTTVTINKMTVAGNSATEGGPIIYGNTVKAILNIHKLNFTDEENENTADDLYWDYAIVNNLTVNDISGNDAEIPPCDTYVPRTEDEEEETEKPVVPVTDVLSLGEKSSDAVINSTYGALPKLDNSSNFMSRNVTKFDNINGGTVTVDSFISHENDPANNVTVGEGLLIYQAILYKQAHPEEEVNISVASFRFSSLAAVNINRNSRYFGYMRNLPGQDYDRYGFVRLSYLMITAAKMGINVTVVGQLDGYPHPASEPTFDEYMESFMDYPCDPAYVKDGKVKDYLNFARCDWTSYDNKAASDMMHTKMCAVSHYLDMNGVAHKNAVWSSSSNLDGINSTATNGNNKMQTATIVSDHEQIYRTAYNYIEILPDYCGQEDVYLFRTLVTGMTKEQIDLIEAGRADEIPTDEQIVYLGTENDDVFELFFAPFGGDVLSWTESYNPYCKYIRKFNNSDDYVMLLWNSANYDKTTPIVRQIEEMIHNTFTTKKNPKNVLYTNLEDFDTSVYEDFVIGEDIGHMSFNEFEHGKLHTKDLQLSYSENGKREYVSILSSINMHGGAMSYQSNYVLVIKEDNIDEGSVFFTFADQTTKGVVEHTYGEVKSFIPETDEDGYSYKQCVHCNQTVILETIHRPSAWIAVKEATIHQNGISYKQCIGCKQILETKEIVGIETDISASDSKNFTSDVLTPVEISRIPYTFEAVVSVPKDVTDRAGVIVGNYKKDVENVISFEIYSQGRPRLYYTTNGVVEDCTFNTDIRTGTRVHVAIAIDGNEATLYINGTETEKKTLVTPLPEIVEDLKLGGDNRDKNTQYFKGSIYSVALFADTRTANEIMQDSVLIKTDAESLLFIDNFTTDATEEEAKPFNSLELSSGATFTESKYYEIATMESTPHTFEATVHVPLDMTERAGVIVGNYIGGMDDQLVVEIFEGGKPRIVFRSNGVSVDHTFATDVRSDGFTHIAITLEDTTAKLYVNGEHLETATLAAPLPVTVSGYKVGGDNRTGNRQYFKGKIQSVALFSDARTESEIKADIALVTNDVDGLLYSGYYNESTNEFATISGRTFNETDIKGASEANNTPYTFEAIVNVPKDMTDRAGVIVGNYELSSKNLVNFEVYNEGKIRLYWRDEMLKIYSYVFNTDIRSDNAVHLALTVNGRQATLYVNGEKAETATLPAVLPRVSKDYKIGGDNRVGNTQYFKGTIYGVALYSEAKTEEDIVNGFMAGGESLMYKQYFTESKKVVSNSNVTGKTFSPSISSRIPLTVNAVPLTFEATVNVPVDIDDRAGVIVGNYATSLNTSISFEIFSQGRVRLYHKVGAVTESCVFDTDIRSNKMEHIAITVNEKEVTLYLNGDAVETKTMQNLMPDSKDGLKIGGDNRTGNIQYFKGTIGTVTLFSDVRSADEIRKDASGVSDSEDNLLCNMDFVNGVCAGSAVGGGHTLSDWEIVREPSETQCGLKRKQCTGCGMIMAAKEYVNDGAEGKHIDYTTVNSGLKLSSHSDAYSIEKTFDTAPLTYEAFIKLPKTFTDRAGVIVGNYQNGDADQVNIEIYNNGKPRLYYKTNGVATTCLFNTDVRSDTITHIAITIDGLTATLYVNGEKAETLELTNSFSNATSEYLIGSDNRRNNPPWFKGEIYGVALFEDVRTEEEIKLDSIMIPRDAEDLVFLEYFAK